jgi:DNA repair exonuclease SbcCD ATPase subunit
MSIELVKALLASPVLVASVPALLSVFFGRLMLQAKDEQIKSRGEAIEALKQAHVAELKAKEAEVAALERWMPANIQAQVDGLKQFYDVRGEQLSHQREQAERERDQAQEEVDRVRGEGGRSRAELEAVRLRLDQAEGNLATTRAALEESDRGRVTAALVSSDLPNVLIRAMVAKANIMENDLGRAPTQQEVVEELAMPMQIVALFLPHLREK